MKLTPNRGHHQADFYKLMSEGVEIIKISLIPVALELILGSKS